MFNLFKKKEVKTQDPDEMVLSHLIKAGSNITKPHTIDFFLYFTTQEDAEKAKVVLQKEGRIIEIKTTQPPYITCQIVIEMKPNLQILQNIRQEFQQIAKQYNGMYDGWGTEIEE
ncbi:MAG: ribonuclease E inhibitor RraB [bacterium]